MGNYQSKEHKIIYSRGAVVTQRHVDIQKWTRRDRDRKEGRIQTQGGRAGGEQ